MTEDGVEFADSGSETTSFFMPEKNVSVTAMYKDILYSITVTGGKADKTSAAFGETIKITAGPADRTKTFDKWITSDGLVFADENHLETTFVMPAKDVALTATFKNLSLPDTYTVTVIGGEADKAIATQGETVTVSLPPPPPGWSRYDINNVILILQYLADMVGLEEIQAEFKYFDKWTSPDISDFENANHSSTTFVMPNKNVKITAAYKSSFDSDNLPNINHAIQMLQWIAVD